MNEKLVTIKDAIRGVFIEELEKNPHLFVLGEEIVRNRKPVLEGVSEKFPDRVINNLPLLEDMLCGIGLGMSIGGLTPVIVFNYDTHLTLGVDDLYRIGTWRYRMAEPEGPGILVRLSRDRWKGPEFSASLQAIPFHLPNLWIACPSTPYHVKGLLKTSLYAKRPVIFWEHKEIYVKTGAVPEDDYSLPFGTSSFFSKGKHLTVITWLYMSYLAQEAAEILHNEGIELEVISLQTLQPMDMQGIFASLKKTGKALIVEEDILRGGIGAEIAARINEKMPDCRIRRLATKNVALPRRFLEKLVTPTTHDIIQASRDFVAEKRKSFFSLRSWI